jgi:hypothetical protein
VEQKVGAWAFSPIGNGRNRMDRICRPCVRKL